MTLDYTAIRVVHTGAAALSISLFALRGLWMLRAPERLRQRWVRIVPHVIDTVLLASPLGILSRL